MPMIDTAPPSANFAETPEEKAKWVMVRKYLKANNIIPGSTFTVRVCLRALGTNNGKPFIKMVKGENGEEKPWAHFKGIIVVIDERFGGDGKANGLRLPPKDVGYSWFDGQMSSGTTSPNRGGMYALHTAIYHAPPSDGRENNKPWPTEDYEGKPFLMEWEFMGTYKEGDKYYGTRANLNLRPGKFRPDPTSEVAAAPWSDDDDDLDALQAPTAAPALDDEDDLDEF